MIETQGVSDLKDWNRAAPIPFIVSFHVTVLFINSTTQKYQTEITTSALNVDPHGTIQTFSTWRWQKQKEKKKGMAAIIM